MGRGTAWWVAAFLLTSPLSAGAKDVATAQVEMLQKALRYDRSISDGGAARSFVVALVGEAEEESEIAAALQRSGLKVRPVAPVEIATGLQGVDVAWVAGRWASSEVARACAIAGVLSVSGSAAAVEAGHVSLGLTVDGAGRGAIVVNAAQSQNEGHAFHPQFLRMARLVGAGEKTQRLRRGMTPPKVIPETVVEPSYPPELRSEGVAGRVMLLVHIGVDGTVLRVEKQNGHPRLAEAAAEAVRKWRFEPARDGSTPVAVKLPYPVVFRLDG